MQVTVVLLCVAFGCLAHVSAEEQSPPAEYEFSYAVNDPLSGDQKDQHEIRNGDDVSGYYRTLDSDGLLRTVKYKADAINGFTAEVVREPVGGDAAVKAVPVAVPTVTRAHSVPVTVPAPYYPYNYRSPYSYSYQPYSYSYQSYPYSYGYQPYYYQPSYGYSQYPFGVRK